MTNQRPGADIQLLKMVLSNDVEVFSRSLSMYSKKMKSRLTLANQALYRYPFSIVVALWVLYNRIRRVPTILLQLQVAKYVENCFTQSLCI